MKFKTDFISASNILMLFFNLILGTALIALCSLQYQFESEYRQRSNNAIHDRAIMKANDSLARIEHRAMIEVQIGQNEQILYLQREVQLFNEKIDILLKTKKDSHEQLKPAFRISD